MKLLFTLVIALALSLRSSWADGLASAEVFRYEQVLGTSFELKVVGASHAQAVKAEAASLAEIDRLAKILSTYDPWSEVSRWLRTRGEAVPVSTELSQVLGLFDHWRVRTGGALDPAAAAEKQVDRYNGFMQEHGCASHTPASDGQRVYVYFGKGGALAFDLDGKEQ